MAYVVPQVTIHQEFTLRPLAVEVPLHAWITGPNAELFRFSESAEKSQVLLGAYDPSIDTDYDYPNRPLGGIVDQSYVKLFAENPLLRYFYDPVGTGSTIAPVGGHNNRVRSDAVNFRTNNAYARDASLYDRDVQVGDVVDLLAVVGGETVTRRTTVRDVIGDVVAAGIDMADTDTANQGIVAVAAATIAQTAGADNCIEAAVDPAAYDGAAEGDISEVYTVEVITGSTGGDLTTARLRVRTASGNDQATNVVPSAAGVATAIGARGLTVTFDLENPSTACSTAASVAGISYNDLIAGQTWVVEVEQAFDPPAPTSGGTYTGTSNTTYVITVTRGGDVAGTVKPQISVTTIHGTDVSGPTNITATATGFAVGTKGVTVSFDEAVLCKGDIYYIDVVAAGVGNMRTLVLSNNLPTAMLAATDITVSLYLQPEAGYIEIPRKRAGSPPAVNYVLGDAGEADTAFTVNGGITTYDASWTDAGVPVPITLNEGTLYVEYRAWVQDAVRLIGIAYTLEDLDDIPGPLHPDNPLKYGVFKAITNAAGVGVMYTGVADPTSTQYWQDALATVTGDERPHAIVPMSEDRVVQDLCVAHVLSQSGAEVGRERRAWFATDTAVTAAGFTVASYYLAAALAGLRSGALPNRPLTNAEIAGFDGVTLRQSRVVMIVDDTTSTDEETVLATISENPDSAGQYTIVAVPEGNSNFVTSGVRVGDTVRYGYTTDGWDTVMYDEYTIDQVLNEDTLRLRTGPAAPVTVPQRLEVHRTTRGNDYADLIATEAGTFGNRRIMLIHPVGDSNRSQQDTMANAGTWLVTQADTGEIVSRHTLTTAGYGDVLQQEEMIGANVDSMVRRTRKLLEPYIGRVNVVDGTISLLYTAIDGLNNSFTQPVVEALGGQLRDYVIVDIRQHAVLPDRIVVDQAWLVPSPLNTLEVFSQVVV